MTYLALAWLVALVLAANAGASIPDGFGMTVFFVTLWSLGFLFFRLAVAGRSSVGSDLALSSACSAAATARRATFVERDYDDTNCDTYDNCDNCDN